MTPFACAPGPGGPKWALGGLSSAALRAGFFCALFLELQENHQDTNSKCSLGFRNMEQNGNN